MDTINWSLLIRALIKSGVTQPQIAESCGCGQSTISDMLRGKTTDPRTSLGLRLLRLAEAREITDPTVPRVVPVVATGEVRDAA